MRGGGALGVLAGPLGGRVGEDFYVFHGAGVGGDEHEERADARDDGGASHLAEVLQLVKHRLLAREDDSRERFLLRGRESNNHQC